MRLSSCARQGLFLLFAKSGGDLFEDPIHLLVCDLHLRQPGLRGGSGEAFGGFNYQKTSTFSEFLNLGIEI